METKIKRLCSWGMSLLLVVVLTACAAVGPQPGEVDIRSGVIEQITETQLETNHHPGVGAVVGGVAGLGVGSLFGSGSGRDVAMVLGTLGGALAGNEVQKRYEKPVPAQQIMVRMSNGVLVSVTQPTDLRLSMGQKVYIEGSGEAARVVPQ